MFRSSRTFFLNIFSEAAACNFKKQEIFSEAATHLLKHKKYVQMQLHKFFTVSAQNIHTLRVDFYNLSRVMKNIFDGWLKNFVQESNTVIPLHLHRFVGPLFGSHSLAPFLGVFGNFSIFLLATKLCADAFWPVLETSSVILSLPE